MQIIENNITEQAIIGCAQNAYTAPIMAPTKPIKMAVAIKSDRAIFFIDLSIYCICTLRL